MLQQLRKVVAPSARRFRQLSRYVATKVLRQPMSTEETIGLISQAELRRFGWVSPNGEFVPGYRIGAEDVMVDVGCGSGWAASYAAAHGAEVVAVDVMQEAVDQAIDLVRRCTPKARARGIVSECNPIPLPSAFASRIVCLEVAEHVDDPVAFFAELARIGKPGAQYLISVPDPAGETVQRFCAPPAYWAKPNHLRIIQREEFENLARGAGLVVEDHRYFGFYWAMWWILRWTFEKDCPAGAGANQILQDWNRVWIGLMNAPSGAEIIQGFEAVMPKSQVLLARKPG